MSQQKFNKNSTKFYSFIKISTKIQLKFEHEFQLELELEPLLEPLLELELEDTPLLQLFLFFRFNKKITKKN